jgi:hypothetical protein
LETQGYLTRTRYDRDARSALTGWLRINDHPNKRLDDLLPWNWQPLSA